MFFFQVFSRAKHRKPCGVGGAAPLGLKAQTLNPKPYAETDTPNLTLGPKLKS